MLVIKTIQEFLLWRNQCQYPVDLVPTMGALHDGHLSLCEALQSSTAYLPKQEKKRLLVLSIFINPKQFDNPNDLTHYPLSLDQDLKLCRQQGVDVVFVPGSSDIYEANASIIVQETQLSSTLCGAKRFGHFDGVCLVVSKLFNIVRPERVAFGKKDFQQIAIIKRLIRDLSYSIELLAVETKREQDGLAMSSRNRRLSKKQRARAPIIYQLLLAAKSQHKDMKGDIDIQQLQSSLEQAFTGADVEFSVDYLTVVNEDSLEPCSSQDSQALLVIACFVGSIRLIDSIALGAFNVDSLHD